MESGAEIRKEKVQQLQAYAAKSKKLTEICDKTFQIFTAIN